MRRRGLRQDRMAHRAAFIAVADGKQVVVLCPTTLLAEQHYQTFADRFADWPIRVAELSRFKSAKEQAQAVKPSLWAKAGGHPHRHPPAAPEGRHLPPGPRDHR